jgi:16S rRNA (adenine1518-N6/adenine1519-N6)-dimethyltransferase
VAYSAGIRLKKKFGQHFLRDSTIIDHMIEAVVLDATSSVFEIGCGDGVLTQAIMRRTPIARLWVFEIDPEWAAYVKGLVKDSRMQMFERNFLDVTPDVFEPHQPWTVLANLPYQVTFPILHWFLRNRALLKEGVVMVQEEVAHKITARSGRGYGYVSLFFQHYFDWKKLDKVPPGAFLPPPKVFSRLLYFKPRPQARAIADEPSFWRFIQHCFKQPRRTLRNNLASAHYQLHKISDTTLNLRAQQLSMDELLALWDSIR